MSKGSNAERELVNYLWDNGYAPLRAPGSGTVNRPSPDVIAIKQQTPRDRPSIIAVELKANADGTAHFKEHEIQELEEWANKATAESYIGVKPDLRSYSQWYFLKTYKLHRTENGFSLRKQDHEKCRDLTEVFECR